MWEIIASSLWKWSVTTLVNETWNRCSKCHSSWQLLEQFLIRWILLPFRDQRTGWVGISKRFLSGLDKQNHHPTKPIFYLFIPCDENVCVCVCVSVWVTQSCPTLCDPMDYSLPSSSVHGILRARILERAAISFPRICRICINGEEESCYWKPQKFGGYLRMPPR